MAAVRLSSASLLSSPGPRDGVAGLLVGLLWMAGRNLAWRSWPEQGVLPGQSASGTACPGPFPMACMANIHRTAVQACSRVSSCGSILWRLRDGRTRLCGYGLDSPVAEYADLPAGC